MVGRILEPHTNGLNGAEAEPGALEGASVRVYPLRDLLRRRRVVGQDLSRHRSHAGHALAADDDDGARGVLCALEADRAEEQTAQPVPVGADNEQVGGRAELATPGAAR